MKDFFFFFFCWVGGSGEGGISPSLRLAKAGGKIPGTYFFYPIHITERQTYKKNCPKGSGGSTPVDTQFLLEGLEPVIYFRK